MITKEQMHTLSSVKSLTSKQVDKLRFPRDFETAFRKARDFARCLFLDGRYIDSLPEEPRQFAEIYGIDVPEDLIEWMKREDPTVVMQALEKLAWAESETPALSCGGDLDLPRADFGCTVVAIIVVGGAVVLDIIILESMDESPFVIDASADALLKV